MNYVVFRGSNYYPKGGWKDLHAGVDNLDYAREIVKQAREPWQAEEPGRYDWYQIVDMRTQQIVEEG